MEKVGLIAGNRRFPIVFAQAAQKRGILVIAIAIRGDTTQQLKKYVHKIYWIGLQEFSRIFEIFKREGINKVVMAGQINPRRLFGKELNRSTELKALFAKIKDKRADTIFIAIAERLKQAGFILIDSITYLEDFLPKKGTLTKRSPDPQEWEDINFGLSLAKEIASLDIGQTVAVKNKAIVAVEALEGTDNLIRRAAQITGGDIVVVKVSKPKQDLRFDIPVVGLNTVKNLIRVKGACLVIEAEKTLFIDRQASISLADRKGIAIVAV